MSRPPGEPPSPTQPRTCKRCSGLRDEAEPPQPPPNRRRKAQKTSSSSSANSYESDARTLPPLKLLGEGPEYLPEKCIRELVRMGIQDEEDGDGKVVAAMTFLMDPTSAEIFLARMNDNQKRIFLKPALP